ncbi:MAG TPA: TonB-dependent receptor [Vicinamibacterales bacterium]|nr:TonB-dependent receptor [Vicinamibacterales bacterium]
MRIRFPSSLLVCSFLFGAAASAAARDISGTIVDESGRAVPRAYVRAIDASGREVAGMFADESGRFRFDVATDTCRIEASLTGFAPGSASCGDAQPLRLTLGVAPVQETVIVTATRTEAPASQAGVSVTTFTTADLEERRVPLVADLLRTSPGAMVIRTGAPGGVTSLFVRGGESSYNKVLLDGIPLNEPGGPFNFSALTTEGLERLEVVRGAQSALFGSDAMSSVVQLITRRGEGRPQATGTIEAGTYNTVRGGGSVAGASRGVDYSIGAWGMNTDNREPNSAFKDTTLSAGVGAALGTSATLRGLVRTQLQHNGTPGQTAFGRPDLDAFFDQNNTATGVTLDQQLTPRVRQRASYGFTVLHQQSTNLIADPPYTPRYGNSVAPFAFSDFTYDSFNNLHRHHASYQADVRLANDADHGNQLLTMLADWDGERATLDDRLAHTSTPASRDNVGIAAQHQAIWRRFVVTAGGRFEHNQSFGNAGVPRVSGVVVAHQANGPRAAFGDTRLRASAGLGIKEPTILQSFSPSPFFRGNPDLLPEKSRTIDAGIEQRLAADRVRLELTWFDNRYHNLISTRTTNPATFEAAYFNIGNTRARGAELVADAAPIARLHIRGGYTFLDSEIIDSTSPSSPVLRAGQPLFRRPRHSGFAGVNWSRGPFGADLSGLFIGSYVDSDFSSLVPPIVEHDSYATWDARLSYAIVRQFVLLLSIDNLANADYMEPLGYQALGRAVRGGVRVGF